jgi:hypothetical protein
MHRKCAIEKKTGRSGRPVFLLRRLYAARVKAQDTAQIEKTEKPAENLKNFSKKGVAISYFACYNNTCVTATDMR